MRLLLHCCPVHAGLVIITNLFPVDKLGMNGRSMSSREMQPKSSTEGHGPGK